MKLSTKLVLGLCILTSTASNIAFAEEPKKRTPQEEADTLEDIFIKKDWSACQLPPWTNSDFSDEAQEAIKTCFERNKLRKEIEKIMERATRLPDNRKAVSWQDKPALDKALTEYNEKCIQCKEKIAKVRNMQPTASN